MISSLRLAVPEFIRRLPIPGSLGITLNIPIPSWTGILLAAPKQRQSHSKKRRRQLAGRTALRPLKVFGRCPSCGRVTRTHTLCMPCVLEVQQMWGKERQAITQAERSKTAPENYDDSTLSTSDKALNFPNKVKRPTEDQEKLADKGSYILTRKVPQPARPRSK